MHDRSSRRCAWIFFVISVVSVALPRTATAVCPDFLVAPTYSVGSLPFSVAVGDFNGDGKPDLAVADGNGVSILLGNGDDTSSVPTDYPAGSSAASVAVGDFNGDGKSDLAVANELSN